MNILKKLAQFYIEQETQNYCEFEKHVQLFNEYKYDIETFLTYEFSDYLNIFLLQQALVNQSLKNIKC